MFAIGLSVVFSLSGWCRQIQTGFRRSRPTQDTTTNDLITCTGLSPSTATLPKVFQFLNFLDIVVLQPQTCRNIFGLGSFPFARHYLGNHCYFLFLRVLRCFSSPGLPPNLGNLYSYRLGCPIRISPDQKLFALPRSFSQLITSFISSQCQGIHPALLMLDLYSWSAAIIALMTGFCVLCFKSN